MIKVTADSLGLMIVQMTDGNFKTSRLGIPNDWPKDVLGERWLKGLPMDLQVKTINDKPQVLLHAFSDRSYLGCICDDETQAQMIADGIKHLWLEANGLSLENMPQATPIAAASQPSTPSAPSSSAVPVSAGGAAPKSKKAMAAVTLACVAVLGAVGFGSYKFMVNKNQPLAQAPALDLSKMSIDDVAKIDADPKFVQSIQTEMMEAVNVGKEAARSKQTEIEASHIEALKGMGLDPGTSMKSAAACLAAM